MDIEILLALQEARYMEKLKLKIPDSLHTLVLNGNKIKSLRGRLEQVIGDYKQSLSSIPNNVQDRLSALDDVRHMEMEFDRVVKPIEDTYEMMARHDISDVVTDTEYVENISYKWKRLVALARVAQDNLVVIQPALKADLTYKIDFLKEAVEAFANDYNTRGPMVQGLPPDIALDRIAIFQAKFDELWAKHTSYSCGEQLFHLEISEYPELTRIKKQLGLLQRLYQLYSSVITTMERYQKMSWLSIDTEKLGQDVLDFQNSCWKLPKSIKEWSAYNELKKKIDDWNETVPLLELMANKAMQQRHWDKIAFVTGYKLNVNMEGFLLKDLMNATPLEHKDDIEEICVSAVKENDIEGKLNSVVTEWETQTFCFTPFKHRGNLLLKGEHMLELILLMEDNLMLLSSLMSNRYNGPFKLTIQTWVQKLTGTTEVLEMWMAVQNLWVYMEAVFVGGDISKQLPQEARRFQNIDKSWSRVIVRAQKVTNVVQCCVGDDFLGVLLPRLQDQLEICQKSLSGYLEKKRLVFPRFFFVSDPALLEILGQASDPHTIQAHLLSVFDNTKAVVFDDDEYEKILTMVSQEGETIDLEQPVYAKGNVEVWLGEFLKASMRSIQGIVNNAVTDMDGENFNMFDFQTSFPAQVGRLGMQVMWTKEAEAALQVAATERKAMHATSQRFNDMLKQLIDITLKELMPMDRVKFETLVTIHVHQRDIFDDMVKQHVTSLSDFDWLKQSRFYYHHDTEQSVVSITNIDFLYQHEFLGCTERLVITPLTDRCYITLAQALGMSMGGAPSGPAGTGKTETIKDMGRCLGKYVIVFNCSDQMDYRGLGRIFKGLAQSGSWGCFDEFNRIELPVLSVAAQQIAVVHSARKDKKKQFTFTDGDTVFLNPEFGFFLTMNPSYAGRVELPENLKVQFRSVSMMVPDRQIIIRVKLASSGFQNNVVLASKFYTLYVLCEEQLTKQVHYDFGLRNILSVLRTLGAFKRSNPQDSESMIVMRVLRDMNLSKLVDEDEPLFLSLINDLFPGMKLDKGRYPDIEAAIQQQVTKLGLINHEPWVLKLMQLYETQRVRHGMMTLGPSGSGKSTCIQVLMKAMTEVGVPHKEMRMNPKAITAAQMFGKLDVTTNDWTDGIFSALWRKTLRTKKGEHTWIVLDGPIDAIWIENLNSVLDDNKTLTLANGDRIPMSPSCKVIFEPDNIENASPATVSRNGMVYMSSSVLDWNPVLRAWMKKQPKGMADRLLNLFQWNFESLYNFVEVHLNAKMSVLQINYIKQAINLLEGLIPRDGEGNVRDHNPVLLERLFVFTCMWSLGALLETDDRNKLQEFFYQQKRMDMPPVNNDDESTMFDYFVDSRGSWQHWKTKVPGFEYPSNFTVAYPTILVPNVDNVRTEFLINAISAMGKAVLLIGEQGTAKTVIIKNHCNKYDQEHHLFKNFSFSSATTPMIFQRTIESYVDKRIGNNYGPPNGRKMTVFVDDLNLPVVNEWGDQPTNETMRQLLEMKGFYNLEKPGDFTKIADVQFVAAMIQPGGGRNDIPSRLKRHFSIFNCTLPSDQSIDQIFSVICKGHFRQDLGFSREICRTAAKLVPLTRRLWQNTKQCMMPTPAKFHYIFNLRDLSRIWQGMLNATSEVVAEKDNLIRLWKHECTRVIADRFVCEDDTRWFRSAQQELVESSFSKDDIKGSKSDVYFADFLREAPEPTGEEDADIALVPPKIYEPIESFDKLRVKLLSYVGQYNESTRGDGLDLVFFRDAMVHMVRIARVLATPQGNCLLVGVGGCGKRVLTKLASFINGYQFHTITLARGYNVSNFLDDLKGLFRRAGVDAKKITFFFCEKDIKDESFMEYMNNILSSGEISNLFTRDETEEICQFLTPVFKRERLRTMLTTENLYGFFLDRVKANLHIVLSFSPVGERFRNWALKFPGLISGCTMDWFQRWPKDALVAMSQHFLDNFSLLSNGDTRSSLVAAMADYQDLAVDLCQNYFQRFRRQTHVTPKTYLSFLNSYKEVYTNKLEEISTLSARINNGLQKLQEATESVEELSQELLVKEQNLQVASEKAEQVLEEVTEKATLAQNAKRQVQQVKDRAQALVDSIAADKGVAEERLEDAKPALKEAEAALQTILPAHIASVRKLGKPPNLIMLIMDCVLLLFKKSVIRVIPDMKTRCVMPSWQESLKLMSGTAFLQQLLNFPKDTINDEVTELLEPYLRREDYNIVEARRVCGDVAGLCSWTRAMVFFHGINKEALPLKDNVAKAEARLRKAVADLDQAETELSQKQQELDTVKAMYESALLEKQRLVDDAAQCRRKIENAKALLLGLSDEKLRWTESSGTFRYPLLIDPQGQGKHWIRNRESGNNLLITSLNHRYFKVNLEDCLSQGRPILIENLGEEIDPVLDNILQKNFYKVGAFHKVSVLL
ncbi:PREDICTED: dynein heavy chain 5, axonemal-like [Priapulus caudatus]|uniref:Dynein heavy chain 5, axonemal-like n=1 Tax=Priapulus caudatus TaxID=37621 RepID=A0ABM1ENG2_PRICU|nr:PREDICTED: dynein heavy chain 5, axonemal-like [Priapulus caudatus]